jgi:hypothetical protein
MAMNALVLEGSDDPLDHAVLFWGVRRDELLLQPIAFNHGRVPAAREDQAVVGPQQERLLNPAEVSVAGDQGFCQGRLFGLGSTATAEVPSEQLSLMAIDHQGQRGPVIPAAPNSAHIRGSALIWSRGNRRKSLNPLSESDGSFANLPAHDSEHALDRVLIHVQQVRHGAIPEAGFSSIMALIGSTNWACNLGSPLVGL